MADFDVARRVRVGPACGSSRRTGRHARQRARAAAQCAADRRPATRPAGRRPGCWRCSSRSRATKPAWRAGRAHEPVHFLARGFLRYAEAVVAGRAGEPRAQRCALLGRGDDALAGAARGTGTRPAPRGRGRAGRRVGRAGGVARAMRWRSSTDNGDAPDRLGVPVAAAEGGRARAAAAERGDGAAGGIATSWASPPESSRCFDCSETGCRTRTSAARLYLSPRTVERHIASLTAKAGVDPARGAGGVRRPGRRP